MSALTWLRLARRVPGLGSQPELPNLEALIESEAPKTKDEFHNARWIVPLVLTIVGCSVFIPLSIQLSPYFLFGAIGLPLIGGVLGLIFHAVAKSIPLSHIRIRKRCQMLLAKLVGLKNLLGWSPVLSPKVAAVLEEAAALYLKARRVDEPSTKQEGKFWDEALERAETSMDEAMAQMLLLVEPESPQAQDAELDRGWAEPLLEEMRLTVRAIEEHRISLRSAALVESRSPALAGLREARQDLQRIESAVSELEQEVR